MTSDAFSTAFRKCSGSVGDSTIRTAAEASSTIAGISVACLL
jgi:hypothetical protein